MLKLFQNKQDQTGETTESCSIWWVPHREFLLLLVISPALTCSIVVVFWPIEIALPGVRSIVAFENWFPGLDGWSCCEVCHYLESAYVPVLPITLFTDLQLNTNAFTKASSHLTDLQFGQHSNFWLGSNITLTADSTHLFSELSQNGKYGKSSLVFCVPRIVPNNILLIFCSNKTREWSGVSPGLNLKLLNRLLFNAFCTAFSKTKPNSPWLLSICKLELKMHKT